MKARMNLRIDADLKRRIEDVSVKRNMSMSSLVEELIARELEHPKGEYLIIPCRLCRRMLLVKGETLNMIKKLLGKGIYCGACVRKMRMMSCSRCC